MSFLNSCDHEAGSFMINKPESHIILDHVCVIKNEGQADRCGLPFLKEKKAAERIAASAVYFQY